MAVKEYWVIREVVSRKIIRLQSETPLGSSEITSAVATMINDDFENEHAQVIELSAGVLREERVSREVAVQAIRQIREGRGGREAVACRICFRRCYPHETGWPEVELCPNCNRPEAHIGYEGDEED